MKHVNRVLYVEHPRRDAAHDRRMSRRVHSFPQRVGRELRPSVGENGIRVAPGCQNRAYRVMPGIERPIWAVPDSPVSRTVPRSLRLRRGHSDGSGGDGNVVSALSTESIGQPGTREGFGWLNVSGVVRPASFI